MVAATLPPPAPARHEGSSSGAAAAVPSGRRHRHPAREGFRRARVARGRAWRTFM